MNLKNENISVKEMYLEKIEKLKIIVSLYKQDMYQAIIDLNFIYDNYQKFIEEKNKEMAKYLKKEKYSIDLNKSNKSLNSMKSKIKYIKNVPENKRYLYYILITLVGSIIVSISFLFEWISYHSVTNRINELIGIHDNLSNDIYKIMNYYQLMIFRNFTTEDINNFENYPMKKIDLLSNMYTEIENLYDSKKLLSKLEHYNLGNIDSYYNYTCETFYEYLFKSNIVLRNINPKYKHFLTLICNRSNIFNYNNYKQIFGILFEYLQIGINEINDHTYGGLINIRHKKIFQRITLYYLSVYQYTLEILGIQLQRKSYQKITSLIDYYMNIAFSIYYIYSFVLILAILFGYIMNINSNYNKIHELKKVFKICNKKD